MHSASLFNNWQWKEPYSDYNMIFAANKWPCAKEKIRLTYLS